MTIDISHKVAPRYCGKAVSPRFLVVFIRAFLHFLSVAMNPILFKLAGNENMHNILIEFKFQPDQTTDYGVSCH